MKLPDRKVQAPVVNGKAYNRDFIKKVSVPDGWYNVSVFGQSKPEPLNFGEVFRIKPNLAAYYFAGEYTAFNFNQARDCRFKEAFLLPANIEDFSLIQFKLIRGKLFYLKVDMPNPNLMILKNEIDNEAELTRKPGMTPEQIYLMGAYAIQAAEKIQIQKELEKEQTLEGRVTKALSVSGARLIRLIEESEKYISIVWEFMAERFKSVVNRNDLKVLSLGICVNSADRKHSIESAPLIAKHAIDTGGLYKTHEGSL